MSVVALRSKRQEESAVLVERSSVDTRREASFLACLEDFGNSPT